MLDSSQNSMRDQSQIEHFHLDIAPRTLRAVFTQRLSRASRFKKARIRKLSKKNKQLQVIYAEEHKAHTIENF
jgi:NhaP-type Na+/H+ and K+/H+ antiporter